MASNDDHSYAKKGIYHPCAIAQNKCPFKCRIFATAWLKLDLMQREKRKNDFDSRVGRFPVEGDFLKQVQLQLLMKSIERCKDCPNAWQVPDEACDVCGLNPVFGY